MPQGQKIVLLLKAYCFKYEGLDLTTSRVFDKDRDVLDWQEQTKEEDQPILLYVSVGLMPIPLGGSHSQSIYA